MQIKIYFGEKPLFLADEISAELEPFRHHDDAVFIDEFSAPAVNAMIHEMQQDNVHAGIFLHTDLDKLKKAFWKKFTLVEAAGGLVFDEAGKMLIIFRRGKWDLPKGKLDAGESLEQCAVREVQEETGLQDISLGKFLITTFHTYHENGKHMLKESHWYRMHANSSQHLTPQAMEDITVAEWVDQTNLAEMMRNTFPSVTDVIGTNGRTG